MKVVAKKDRMVSAVKMLPVVILRCFIPFDKWHVYASRHPLYVETVYSIANKLEDRKKVIEVGCGLGNLLSGMDFEFSIGFDKDKKVIIAANFLNIFRKRKSIYKHGSFNDLPPLQDADLVVLINWIHSIASKELHESISLLKSSICKSGGFLLTEGVKEYTHYHSREFFEQFGNIEQEIQVEGRTIFLVKFEGAK